MPLTLSKAYQVLCAVQRIFAASQQNFW